MKLLTHITDYNETIQTALTLNGEYTKPVFFHCYWNGALNKKHLYSIQSCYYFNVYQNKHQIILWLENNIPNEYNLAIEKYAEIKYFSLPEGKKGTFLENIDFYYKPELSFYSDVVRYIILYNYGGCWFDLDCFILRNFDPLFHEFGNEICVYQWENCNYPNGAIYIALEPRSAKMQNIIEFIVKRNQGWGFQEAQLTYELPLDLMVLPCSWFDGSWIPNPYNIYMNDFFLKTDKKYDFTNFFRGSFCYHWHNKWDNPIEEDSIISQLISKLFP
jgi:hypothetical protein